MSNRHNRATGLPAGLRWRIFARDGFICRYCGAQPPDAVLHVDHVKPRVAGGTDEESNLVTACQSCNVGKWFHEIPPQAPQNAAPRQFIEGIINCHEEFPQVFALLFDHMSQQGARLETRKINLNVAVFCLMMASIRMATFLWRRAPFGDKSKREFMKFCAAQFDEEQNDGKS